MKKLIMLLAIAAVVISGCKESDTTDPPPIVCKLTKTVTITNGSSVETFYTFDNTGKLDVVKQFTGSGDTSLVRKYTYSGNDFVYSTGKDNSGNTDTVYYTYDASKRIIRTAKVTHITGVTLTKTTDFTYNNTNQVAVTVSRSTTDNVNYTIDSTIYGYTGANVSGFSQFTKVGSAGWSTYRINLGYDDKNNYYKITGEPAVSYVYWSANNLNRFFSPDSTNAFKTINYSNYSSTNYPQNFTVTYDPDQPGTQISGSLTYKCQ